MSKYNKFLFCFNVALDVVSVRGSEKYIVLEWDHSFQNDNPLKVEGPHVHGLAQSCS